VNAEQALKMLMWKSTCLRDREGCRPLSEKALRRACHRINPGISVHGMRSTFRDWVGDNTKFPRELAELALAHASRAPPRLPTGAMMLWRDAAA